MIVSTTLYFKKPKKNWVFCLVPKTLEGENIFGTVLSTNKNKWLKTIWKVSTSLSQLKRRRSNIGNPEYCYSWCWKLGLLPIYEAKSGKKSTMDQELDIWKRVHEIATYNMRRVCVTIKKYSKNKSPYIQIRLFTAKENEAMKKVANVNYNLNEFK